MTFIPHVRTFFLASLVILGGAVTAVAEPMSFDFKDPKGVNGLVFVMDSKLEPIVGIVGGVEGVVSYDPEKPESFSGEVSVDMATVSLINSTMVGHLKGAEWLNISGPFKATMTFDKVASVARGEDGATLLTVDGTMEFGTQEVPLTVVVSATHHPDAAKDRGGAEAGDLLVLRSTFPISRTELGIRPELPTKSVGEFITVTVPIVGYSKS